MIKRRFFYLIACVIAIIACSPYNRSESPVLFYPLGMTQVGENLAFISSNADSRFASGQLVVINAKAAADALRVQKGATNKPGEVFVEQYLVAQTPVPSLSYSPRVVQDHVWFTDRLADNAMAFPTKQGSLACASSAGVQQDCSSQLINVSLNADDPIKLTVLQSNANQVVMAAVFAHSHKVQTFSYKPNNPHTVQVAAPYSLKSFLEPVEKKKRASKRIKKPVFVARDTTLVGPENKKRLAVALETFPRGGGSQFYSPYLVLLPTNTLLEGKQLQESNVEVVDLHALTGAFSVRAIAAPANTDSVFVVMHQPDMLVRIDLNPPHVAAVSQTTCIYPTHVQLDSTGNVYVACYKGDMVQQYNPQTLHVQKSQFLPGMGTATLVVDEQAGYVYVSSLLNDSIAVLDLQDFSWLGNIVSQQPMDREGRKR